MFWGGMANFINIKVVYHQKVLNWKCLTYDTFLSIIVTLTYDPFLFIIVTLHHLVTDL